ncbi:hypothetical protein EMPS_03736 [Entomortierella parvispora]|uniref:FAD-binding domain-containing protein n=1 Tax=Entomortierella parvispora TaxID=205924 RepID=A0A9P3H7B6_9FUNG|nr:hypothetical protein EMPS_03736 [Entomortierella parvispora]
MTLGPTILPVFEQLGMLEELQRFSLNVKPFVLRNEKMKIHGTVGLNGEKEVAGYNGQLFARPELFDLLLSRIPPSKISLGKKVLRVEEKDDKVIIHCSDGSAYRGDILVGADGAYSAVRQNIYRDMKEAGVLPKADSEDLVAGYTCIVGVTDPLDLEKYPMLKSPDCNSEFMGVESRSWVLMSIPNGRVAWACSSQFQSVVEAKKQMFMNSEWGPEANAPMIKEYEDYPIPYGGTMRDLFEKTPMERISKVYLEHKMFQTWHYKRSVLIGDACHKLLPAGGQGAVNSLQDAVILANCLYDLKDNTQKSITAAFQSYFNQRYSHAKGQYETSKLLAKVVGGLNWSERLIRTIFLHYLPQTIVKNNLKKVSAYRPQVTFLPMVPFRGTGNVLPQLPSVRYQRELDEKKKQEQQDAAVTI